jgi:hypothetical protein
MKFTHYQKEFQAKAMAWWRNLSINEMRAFEQKHNALRIGGLTLRSEIARMWDAEGKPAPDEVWNVADSSGDAPGFHFGPS